MNSKIFFTRAQIQSSLPSSLDSLNIKTNNTPIYSIINNKVYNLSSDFFKWHAGGSVAFSQLGKDATDFQKDFACLKTILKNNGFYAADKLFYARKLLEIITLWSLAIAILCNYGSTLFGFLISSFLTGIFWQQCGWLAHDFCHNQVFDNRSKNSYIGLFLGNLFQGFSVGWWKQKHSTHHSMPNVHDTDPDINTMPLLAWSEHALEFFNYNSTKSLTGFIISNQAYLFFPFLAFARMAWAQGSIEWVIGKNYRKYDFPTMEVLEQITLAMHYLWLFGLPLYSGGISFALLWVVASQVWCGLLLSAVFSLNHNGMRVYSEDEAKKMNFYELSILTGRDVIPSPFTDWFMGGLNYQIEHHLFPSMPRHHLKNVAPMVRSLCEKHGISYHTTTFWGGLWEVVSRLQNISKVYKKQKQI